MKQVHRITIVALVVMLCLAIVSLAVAGNGHKTTICHVDGQGRGHTISVDDASLDAHLGPQGHARDTKGACPADPQSTPLPTEQPRATATDKPRQQPTAKPTEKPVKQPTQAPTSGGEAAKALTCQAAVQPALVCFDVQHARVSSITVGGVTTTTIVIVR